MYERSVGAILIYKKKILIQKREKLKKVKLGGFWGLFGGHCNTNESFINSCKREIFEETNLKAKEINFLLEINFKNKNKKFKKRFYFIYLPHNWKNNFQLNEGEKFSIKSQNEIKKIINFVPHDKIAIDFFFNYYNKNLCLP